MPELEPHEGTKCLMESNDMNKAAYLSGGSALFH